MRKKSNVNRIRQLRRYFPAAHRKVMPSVPHVTWRWANNQVEFFHEAVRQRERQMRRFKSVGQAQRFLSVPFATWQQVSCAC